MSTAGIRYTLLYICALWVHSVRADDRTLCVADMETHIPIGKALVYINEHDTVRTNYQGNFVLSHLNFKQLTIRHPRYLTRVMKPEEIQGDTIFLLSNQNALSEVIVYGERKSLKEKIIGRPSSADDPLLKPGVGVSGIGGLDILGFFNFKEKARKRRGRKVRKTLDNY